MTRETHLCFCRVFPVRIVRCNSDWGWVGASSMMGDHPPVVQSERSPKRTLSRVCPAALAFPRMSIVVAVIL